jgi:putative transposase
MARKARFCPPGVPQHIIQRGNNRQACFAAERDFAAYVHWLKEFSGKFDVDLHAWVLMTNHVHLLCTARRENGVSAMMQSLGRLYVRYFNHAYRRTGTLWEGRFKSCLVDAETYLFHLYRYIELNPVRAGMVADPAEYKWSSYTCNALGKRSGLLKPHPLYLALGQEHGQRLARYRAMFHSHVDADMLDDIRKATQKGLALGSDRFIERLERLHDVRLTEGQRGRPRKNVAR